MITDKTIRIRDLDKATLIIAKEMAVWVESDWENLGEGTKAMWLERALKIIRRLDTA